jgi:signal transduction histidine kinase
MTASMQIREMLRERREPVTLALMLLSLHLSMWTDFAGPVSRSFMLIHLGLFLIWQPAWRGDRKLAWYNGLAFVGMAAAFVFWLQWWLIFAWLILLLAFCGGRVAESRQQRMIYMLVLLFLAFQILIRCVPGLFDIELPRDVTEPFAALLPVMAVVTGLLPAGRTVRSGPAVDYLHAVSVATLATLLMVGALLNMFVNQVDYLVAVAQTLVVIGAFLLAIGWLIAPRLGFSGLAQLWMRTIMNIGTPFEHWLTNLSGLFRRYEEAEDFLDAAMEELLALEWIDGVAWKTPASSGELGARTPHRSEFTIEPLTVEVYSRSWLGGALYMHCRLLVQVVQHFYVAKLQERELTRRTHLAAIHETGARVTHDIKNLLQSLHAITSIIVHERTDNDSVSHRLLRRQLPHLTQRLQLALDKLQAPVHPAVPDVYLKDWWQDLRNRAGEANIVFEADVAGDPVVPAELFDSVVENLLENLRAKQRIESDLAITVTLFSDGAFVQLSVCDSGSAIPENKAAALLKEPIKSESGHGIGLYQAARQAETMGYELSLRRNRDGQVCFQLSGSAAQEEGKPATTVN